MSKEKLGLQQQADSVDRLRGWEEKRLGRPSMETVDSSADLVGLIHELRINRTELENQNEELRRAQEELGELHHLFEDLYEFAPCGYLNLDPQGTIIRTNLAGAKLVHDARHRVLHSGFSRYLSPDCEGSYFEALREAGRTGEKQSLELHLGGARGAPGWAWAEIQPDRTEAGEVIRYRLTLVDISAKKEAETALAESEMKYRKLFDDMVCGALLLEIAGRSASGRITDVRILEVNSGFDRLTGIPCDQAVGKPLARIWPQTSEVWIEAVDRSVRTNRPVEVERFHQELGKHLLMSFFQLDGDRIGSTVVDISEPKKSQDKLVKACRDLEIVARERSEELLLTNAELNKEGEIRILAEKKLVEKAEELEARLAELRDANSALQVLLQARDTERAGLEEKVVCNLNELVRPLLAKLTEGNLSDRQRSLLSAIGTSLDEITSPLSRRFIIEASRLTPVETQVAELIRQGRSTKDIADTLGVATSTVDYHRLNIRRRLGLTNTETNLQSYLRSLV